MMNKRRIKTLLTLMMLITMLTNTGVALGVNYATPSMAVKLRSTSTLCPTIQEFLKDNLLQMSRLIMSLENF